MKAFHIIISIASIFYLFNCCHSLIVPQEVPSILSLVFSTIPQVKKGHDSRFGFGFRLGEHADFQVIYELGPQHNTQPIGGESKTQDRRRNVNQEDYEEPSKPNSPSKSTNKEASSWLMNWSNDMINSKKQVKSPSNPVESGSKNPGNVKIKTIPLISEDALKQLQQLYKRTATEPEKPANNENEESKTTTASSEEHKNRTQIDSRRKATISPNKAKLTADLMNVEMD